jgi:hypothetical protein
VNSYNRVVIGKQAAEKKPFFVTLTLILTELVYLGEAKMRGLPSAR